MEGQCPSLIDPNGVQDYNGSSGLQCRAIWLSRSFHSAVGQELPMIKLRLPADASECCRITILFRYHNDSGLWDDDSYLSDKNSSLWLSVSLFNNNS